MTYGGPLGNFQLESVHQKHQLCGCGWEALRLVILLAAQMPFSPNTQSPFSTNEVLSLGFLKTHHWGETVANEVQIGSDWGGALSLGQNTGVVACSFSRESSGGGARPGQSSLSAGALRYRPRRRLKGSPLFRPEGRDGP